MNRYKKWLELAHLDHKQYQEDAIRWCIQRENDPKIRGGILGDMMGLGKTFEMMGVIVQQFVTKTLIVVPPTLLPQWIEILTKYLHPPLVWWGPNRTELTNNPITITTYGLLGEDKLQGVKWDRIIYEEAHHLRNSNTKQTKNACKLSTKITWLVTGTPIQNQVNDMYSLCKILKIPKDSYYKKIPEGSSVEFSPDMAQLQDLEKNRVSRVQY